MRTRMLPLVALAIYLSSTGAFAQSCFCEVPPHKEEAYDLLLFLTPEERQTAEEAHLPWGVPVPPVNATNERLLHQEHYLIGYDDDLRVPTWVAYRLQDEDVVSRSRKDCFRRDPRIASGSAASFCEDYEEPVFQRGHLVPRADMNRSEAAMINTFILTNIAPQYPHFNEGIWRNLESRVRGWANERGEIYVISGAVFDRDGDSARDADHQAELMETGRVAVPTHFYKIILHERPNGFIDNIAILLPHSDEDIPSNRYANRLRSGITSIDQIEEITGIDFSPDMRSQQQWAVEVNEASDLW